MFRTLLWKMAKNMLPLSILNVINFLYFILILLMYGTHLCSCHTCRCALILGYYLSVPFIYLKLLQHILLQAEAACVRSKNLSSVLLAPSQTPHYTAL